MSTFKKSDPLLLPERAESLHEPEQPHYSAFELALVAYAHQVQQAFQVLYERLKPVMEQLLPYLDAWQQANRQPCIDRRKLAQRRARRRSERRMRQAP